MHTQKTARVLAVAGLMFVTCAPLFASAALEGLNGPQAITFKLLVDEVISIINKIIPVLTALAFVLFMVSGFKYVQSSGGSKGVAQAREALLWSVIALTVLFSIWGIIGVMKATLLSATGDAASSAQPTNLLPPSTSTYGPGTPGPHSH